MRKQSMMGTSKYEFNPEQFDIDVENNRERYDMKRIDIEKRLSEIIKSDPVRMDETFSVMLDVLREIKKQYDL